MRLITFRDGKPSLGDIDMPMLLSYIELLKNSSGINVSKSKVIYQVLYDDAPLSVSFIGVEAGVFSFDIITAPRHSNKGYAKRLVLNCVSKFEEECKTKDLRMVVDVVNPVMRKLLLDLGFKIVYKQLYTEESTSVFMEYKSLWH